ncbi:MAG: outer membrane protein assembly factor BamA [Chlamydiales bacterium]|nr:outer membrane protein assembly factor BamA [Chlamydiia bacterium]MCP5507319.1 outer membrane protein assembly factor BamA [Chlamydiales bacterium]
MKTISRFALTLFALLVPFGIMAAPLQYDDQLVEQITITFENDQDTSPAVYSSVKARMKTREGDYFSQAAFDNDLKTLIQEYDRIEPELISVDNKMHVILHIWTKPTIRHIQFHGNAGVNDKELREELAIASCSVFDRLAFNRAFHKLKAYYVKKGYFEAKLSYNIELDTCDNVVDINICIDEGRAGWIKAINFCGFTECEEEELIDMMLTKKYNFFMSWMTGEGTYQEEMVQQDQFIILNYLQNHGYADAEVSIDVTEADVKNRIIITITADRGVCYHFGAITFEGNTLFCDDEIKTLICAHPGGVFSADQLRASSQNITNLYGKKGYIDALVNFEAHLEEDRCEYTVNFTIEEGEQYCVGLIKVMGNCQTQTPVILHETLLVPGEVFNLDKLRRTEARLRNVGYFKCVNVYAVSSDAPTCLGGNFRDVHIEVEETSTGNISFFGAFSTVEQLFGGLNLTEKNFNSKGLCNFWRDGCRGLRGGGEYLHMTVSMGVKSRKYQLSWTKPYFWDTPWSIGFDVESANTRYISDDYAINSYGFSLYGLYRYNAFLRTGWHYRLRYTDIDITDVADATPSLIRQAQNNGIISAFGTSIIYDSTDHPLRPSCGIKSRLENEIAGLGGDFQFFSIAYLNSWYYSVSKDGVIKLRGDMRFIQPINKTSADSIPIDERFFLGGDNEIRGFTPYRLGPQFNDDDPKGGISMQVLSAEYDHRILSCLDAFFFVDSGYLSLAHWDFGNLNTSVGFGIRFQVFEGNPPITMGLGYPLTPASPDEVKHFFISLGGKF